jgi:rubrerythrin
MDDLISRRATVEAMWKALYAYQDLTEEQFMENDELDLSDWFQHRIFVQRMHEECMKAVESIPSAERPTGEWEYKYYTWRCSNCGANPTYGMGYVQREDELFEFCPNCGARMDGV